MPGLYLFGLGCIIYSVVTSLRYSQQDLSNVDIKQFYKNMNRSSIIGGVGSLAFVYDGILTNSYFTIAINSLALVVNVYFYMERNNRIK